jgi:hypothetical protein
MAKPAIAGLIAATHGAGSLQAGSNIARSRVLRLAAGEAIVFDKLPSHGLALDRL